MESTLFKSFGTFSELKSKTSGYSWYVKLHGCGWFAPVSKKGLKKVNDSMLKSNKSFSGDITFSTGGVKTVQITMH